MSVQRILTGKDIPLDLLPAIKPIPYEKYLENGGYTALKKAVEVIGPSGILEEIKKSGLRGRGGAGFPTWKKWDLVLHHRAEQKYLCCNAAEDEPGTLKDRYLLRLNPHQLIEGVILAAHAIGATEAYIYINGNYGEEIGFMETALAEARANGHWGKAIEKSGFCVQLKVCRSPGTYVAGEETALLEVIEGRVAAPRQKPPYYPTMHGLFGMPTVVNNAETLSNIPHIVQKGGAWFQKVGASTSPGSMIFTLTGEVNRPGLYELPLGSSLLQLIEDQGGGIKDGKDLKALFPGGPSNTIISAEQLDVALDFDALKAIGSGLGTGAVIVMSEGTCMVRSALDVAKFFAAESCGQCPPCILGTAQLSELLEKIESGCGVKRDLQQLEQICGMIKGRGQCYLLTGASIAVESIFEKFRQEYNLHVSESRCPAASQASL